VPQVVHEVAGGQDEHPLVAQRRELAAELEQLLLAHQHRHRDLQHGDVGGGEHPHQRAPGAVVDPAVAAPDREPRADEPLDAVGQLRRAGGRVAQLVHEGREAVEVVDELVVVARATDRDGRVLPVRGDREDRARARQRTRPATPGLVALLDRHVQGVAVPHEAHRHPLAHLVRG
jgi:hypothetical protein